MWKSNDKHANLLNNASQIKLQPTQISNTIMYIYRDGWGLGL